MNTITTLGFEHFRRSHHLSNPPPGGGASSALSLNIDNAQPILISFSPSGATSGGNGFSLTVSGSSFSSSATVLWNGSPRATTFLNNNQLTAEISSNDVAASGIVQISVSNPRPGVARLTYSDLILHLQPLLNISYMLDAPRVNSGIPDVMHRHNPRRHTLPQQIERYEPHSHHGRVRIHSRYNSTALPTSLSVL